MLYDYARRCAPAMGCRQRVASRRSAFVFTGRRVPELGGMVVGAIIALAVVISVGSGLRINRDQANLVLEQAQHKRLEIMRRELSAEKSRLLRRERIEKVAATTLKLYPPAGKQLIRL